MKNNDMRAAIIIAALMITILGVLFGTLYLFEKTNPPDQKEVELHVIDKWWEVDAMLALTSRQSSYLEGNEDIEIFDVRAMTSIGCREVYSGREPPLARPDPPCHSEVVLEEEHQGYQYSLYFDYYIILAYYEGAGYPTIYITDPSTWDDLSKGDVIIATVRTDDNLITGFSRKGE